MAAVGVVFIVIGCVEVTKNMLFVSIVCFSDNDHAPPHNLSWRQKKMVECKFIDTKLVNIQAGTTISCAQLLQ